MKILHINTFKKIGAVLGAALLLTACTKNFESLNKNPYDYDDSGVTPDFRYLGDPLIQVQNNIYSVNPVWVAQIQQNLNADVYSGYMMSPTPFAGNVNNLNYSFIDGWNTFIWSTPYSNIMPSCKYVMDKVKENKNYYDFYAWAQILRVEGMHRITDIYGPIIYTKYGSINSDGSITYDSQQEAYNAFFADLKEGIDTLTAFENRGAVKALTTFDMVYGGSYKKWVQFANTLRLRLAIRIAKADPNKAKAEGEAALAHPFGLLTSGVTDNFLVNIDPLAHPLNVYSDTWGDIRMSAPMESFLVGYHDPRLPKYFQQTGNGDYKGIRNGIAIDTKDTYVGFSKLATLPSKVQLMTAAEAWFLKAEAGLNGWANAGDPKANYEAGVKASFDQHGLGTEAATYLADGTSKAKPYVDPNNAANNVPAGNKHLSTITIKWDAAATNAEKLERIITQKWLATFPEGCEGWAEFRRTTYPKLFPVVVNNSNGTINTEKFIRRIVYPSSEYNTNASAVQKAIQALGGPDNGGTPLWWDKN
ncbi:SusD/RagB-like outer membrane lipoprotein [Chitinophaga skermanii]|uniref:SusD/RagB-like outer membrane lipoprotein n=1 Tax=Chitinophaga skermanii TaxID=331697 RepID=A0A327QGX5_9BACT|nr:SusD/RagB family nutrient-binding outer membrane lipoprotein [Chitinophaga skermanii]RAJ02583.1 SusD/RagB-like outer membrane lipoprotein [Chitinophaga skermanii]